MARLLLGMAAYLVPTFALGVIWHLFVFADLYEQLEIYRPNLIVPFGFVAMAVQGLIYSFAYSRLLAGSSVGSGALRFGAIAAPLAWTYGVLAVAAKHPMTSVPAFIAIETAFTAAQYILVSPLLAAVWRKPLSVGSSVAR